MLSKMFIGIVACSWCLQLPEAHAVYLIHHKDSKSPAAYGPVVSNAYALVQENSWPAVINKFSKDWKKKHPELQKLLETAPAVETDYLKSILKSQLGTSNSILTWIKSILKRQRGVSDSISLTWIPPTVWDLFVLKKMMTEKTFRDRITSNLSYLPRRHFESNDFLANLHYDLSNEFLSAFSEDVGRENYNSIIKELLLAIKSAPHQEQGEKDKNVRMLILEMPKVLSRFTDESGEFTHDSHFLQRIIEIEIEAHKSNQVLLWRAAKPSMTTGFSLSEEIPKADSKSLAFPTEKELIAFPLEEVNSKSLSFKKPLLNQLKSLGLSFSYSPLAGSIFDGGFDGGIGACTFLRIKPPGKSESKFCFVLKPKAAQFYVDPFKQYLCIPDTPLHLGVFGAGERFHPRLQALPENPDHDSYENGLIRLDLSEVSKELGLKSVKDCTQAHQDLFCATYAKGLYSFLGKEMELVTEEGQTCQRGAPVSSALQNQKALAKQVQDVMEPFISRAKSSLLCSAVEKSDLGAVKELVQAGDVELSPCYLKKALHIAAQKGHLEIVKTLVEAKAQVDQSAEDGITPVGEASKAGHAPIVKLLLEHGAKPIEEKGKEGSVEKASSKNHRRKRKSESSSSSRKSRKERASMTATATTE